MRRTLSLAAMMATFGLAACGENPTLMPGATASDGPMMAAGDAVPIYLVTFKPGVDVAAAANDISHARGFALRHVREFAAPGFSAVIPGPQLDAVRSDPRVLLVEQDGPVHLIDPFPGITGKPASGGTGGSSQVVPWGITRVGGAGDGTGKTAWIIDTGIDMGHADLNTSRNCHAYFTGTSAQDGNGHGTHVAGTIAAKNNTIDVVGVAANAYVCSVRVLGNSGSGTWEGVVNGVNYVAANGANGDVANMSLGGSGSNATLEKAVQDAAAKGIKFAIAAGNDGVDAGTQTPSRTNGPNVYTISATDSNDCMPSWSNWGNPPVDYAAPGVSILSTRKGGGTTTMSGTSMAAPHAAGVLLLGAARTSGFAKCDPDGNPDPIISR